MRKVLLGGLEEEVAKSIVEALDKRREGYIVDVHLLASIIADQAKQKVYAYVVSVLSGD